MGDSEAVGISVHYELSWLTWVGATTTCLKALGIECDLTEVAGQSGYAFMLCIENGLCPSGPTMFDWGMLDGGVNVLGRSTLAFTSGDCHTGDRICDRTRDHCRVAYELAERETATGRPCVLWGAYVPEFAVVTQAKDGIYHVQSIKGHCGEPEPPLAYDALDAPGGPYLLAFPSPTPNQVGLAMADRLAIGRAAQLLTMRSLFSNYGFGLGAYDRWIQALERDQAHPFGNAYCAQCYAEGRRHARDFTARVAARQPAVSAPLSRASQHYVQAAQAMEQVAQLFPFPPAGPLSAEQRTQALPLLVQAKDAEARAVSELNAAVEMDWSAEQQAAAE